MCTLQTSPGLLGHGDLKPLNLLWRQPCWENSCACPSCAGLQDTSALVRRAQLPTWSWRWAKTSFISHFLQMLWGCWEVFLYHLKQLLPSNFQQTAFKLSWQFLKCRRAITMTAQSTGGDDVPHHPHLVFMFPYWAQHYITSATPPAQSSEQWPIPLHLWGEPQASNRSHELLQESFLPLVVLELVADEDKGFHKSTLLHLRQQ